MNILKTTLLALSWMMTLTASAADFTVQSASPLPGSVINAFNRVDLILAEPVEAAEVTVNNADGIFYNVEQYGTASSVAPGLPGFTVSRTRSGGIRFGFTDEAISELQAAGVEFPIVTPARYKVHADAGSFSVTDAEGNVYTCPEINYTYELLPSLTFESTPENNSKVGILEDQITLQFPHFENAVITNTWNATLKSAAGTEVPLGDPGCATNVVWIPLQNGMLETPGTYTLTVGVGSLQLTGGADIPDQINPEIRVTIEVLGRLKPTVKSISPEPGIIDSFGSVALVYSLEPRINRDCTEPFRLTRDGKVICEALNTSSRIQGAIDDQDPGTMCFVFVNSIKDFYTEPGTYKFEVPEGFFYFGSGEQKAYSEKFEAEYVIERKFAYTVSPMPGAVEYMEKITVTFPEAVSIEPNELEPDEDGGGVVAFYSWSESEETPEMSVTYDGNKIIYEVPRQTSRCQYALVLPFGAYTLTAADGYTTLSQALTFVYNIPNVPIPTLDPAPGEYTELGDINVTLDPGFTFQIWFPSINSPLKKVNDDGTYGETAAYWKRPTTTPVRDQNTVLLSPIEKYDLAPGRYALVITQRTFSFNAPEDSGFTSGFLLSDLPFQYTIIPDESTEMTPEYEDGYEFQGRIESFGLNFEKARTVAVTDGGDLPTVTDIDGNNVENGLTLSAEGTSARLTLTPALEINGEYIFTVPAGALTINGHKSPEYKLIYGIVGGQSGVGTIAGASEAAHIYGIDGVRIKGDVKDLPAGLYIIDGKKVVK